jgi:hypothetical protein
VHQALSATAEPAPKPELENLAAEVRALRQMLWLALAVAAVRAGFACPAVTACRGVAADLYFAPDP